MHPISQILQRNLYRHKACESGLWINPEKDLCWQEATGSCASLKLLCQQHGAFVFHRHTGADVVFTAFPDAQQQAVAGQLYDWIIINLPRHKALLNMLLDAATSLLDDAGTIWLAGENKAGIKSANKILKARFARVTTLDNARHCTLYEATSPLQRQVFNANDYQEKWLLRCNGKEIKVASYPGVFAHGRLDDGTALLLDTLSGMDFHGDILDFGCGAGVIGTCIAANNKNARLSFLDTSAVALKACEQTLAANRLSGTLLASDGLAGINSSYHTIISNPPIHAGVKTDNRLSHRLLETVHRHIKPGGSLILVANRHLPYENWLSQHFQRVQETAANRAFKVITANI